MEPTRGEVFGLGGGRSARRQPWLLWTPSCPANDSSDLWTDQEVRITENWGSRLCRLRRNVTNFQQIIRRRELMFG